MKTFLFLLCGLLPGVWRAPAAHDFHISRVQVEYAQAEREWQISFHIFIDDLEAALRAKGAPALHLGTQKEAAEADTYIQNYLRRHFQLAADGKPLAWQWVGKEMSEDLSAFWIYLHVPDATAPKQLRIHNKILLELFDDQQNMVQVAHTGRRPRSYLFHREHWEEVVGF